MTSTQARRGQAQISAAAGADRRSAKNAGRPLNQSREAHHSACPLRFPSGGHNQHRWLNH